LWLILAFFLPLRGGVIFNDSTLIVFQMFPTPLSVYRAVLKQMFVLEEGRRGPSGSSESASVAALTHQVEKAQIHHCPGLLVSRLTEGLDEWYLGACLLQGC
jgi:hypothetical protein